MLRSVVMSIALCVAANSSSAQALNRALTFDPASVRSLNQSQSLPLFLRTAEDPQTQGQRYTQPRPHLRECPMPVHRPDTSWHAQAMPMRINAANDPAMIAEMNCPNPLDKKVQPGPFARADSLKLQRIPAKF